MQMSGAEPVDSVCVLYLCVDTAGMVLQNYGLVDLCVCSGFGIKCEIFCVLFPAAMEGSPHKRARMSKAQREVRDCGSVRELWNLPDNSLVNFTGALLDMSDLRYVETRQAGRDCMSAHF